MRWRKEPTTTVYPPTIDGYTEVVATGERIPLKAKRTGELEDGCEVCVIETAIPLRAFQFGRVSLHLAVLPAKSTIKFAMIDEEHPDARH